MVENEQQVLDGFTQQKGEAKYSLHRNAATAARYAKKNSALLVVIIVLLAFILIEDKWLSDEQEQTTGLKLQAAEHLAIISEQKKLIETLHHHKDEFDARELAQLKKIRQLAESDLVYKGMLFDEPNFYISAEMKNEFRRQGHYGEPHKFTFSRWHIALRARIIDQCIADNKVNSLRWFAEQDGWQLIDEKRRLAAALVLAEDTETASND
tara:strand:+ start:188 stop:817 length:630 start_codon:yes stop_codon:yes gene_type:complete